MSTICLYLHIHQPWRVTAYRYSKIGSGLSYFDDDSQQNTNNRNVLLKVVEKSYRPAAELLLCLLHKHSEFRFSLSITGIVIEQLEQYSPETLELLVKLVKTGRVEIIGETYHHSLAFFYSLAEFERQVALHERKIQEVFGLKPRVFRNTELAYCNELGLWAESRGYKGILAEGWEPVLGWRSPNFLYKAKDTRALGLLLKNYQLSDDIAFRFSEKSWEGWPLTVDKFAARVAAAGSVGRLINLFMDFETFGEHQWADTGIFDFLEHVPLILLADTNNNFMTPSEVVDAHEPADEIDVTNVVTWADTERDLSAWVGNKIQQDALRAIFELESDVYKSADAKLIEDWRRLTTSDHFYYMCTKWFNDGDVHAYFNPYETPYDAFCYFMNVVADLKVRLRKHA